jgi:N-acetylglucosamine malate deacetylase 1
MKMTRRNMLMGAGATALAFRASGALSMSESSTQERKLKIVIAGGHPGDPEYGCGGTATRFTRLGHEVVLLYLNNGGWPPTPPSARIAEAKKACEILGARPLYADQENGHAIVDNAHYEAYAKILNAEKPNIVFTQWPIDNHRDHRAITMLTYDAWQESKHSFALYYYEVSDGEDTLQFSPTHYININDQEPVKRAACYAHASQTPDRYYKLQDDVANFRGIESGYKRAEAFISQLRNLSDPLQVLMEH